MICYPNYLGVREKKVHVISDALIQLEGNVDLKNASLVKNACAGILVAGNTVFKSGNPLATIKNLKTS